MGVNWNNVFRNQAHGMDPCSAFYTEQRRAQQESHERSMNAIASRVRRGEYNPDTRANLGGLDLPNYQYAQRLKQKYPAGTRIVLLDMSTDPRPLPRGLRATVIEVDNCGVLHCEFDNGVKMGVIPDRDEFRALNERELAAEASKEL